MRMLHTIVRRCKQQRQEHIFSYCILKPRAPFCSHAGNSSCVVCNSSAFEARANHLCSSSVQNGRYSRLLQLSTPAETKTGSTGVDGPISRRAGAFSSARSSCWFAFAFNLAEKERRGVPSILAQKYGRWFACLYHAVRFLWRAMSVET